MEFFKKSYPWLLAPAFFLLVGYAYHSGDLNRAWVKVTKSAPLAEYPRHIDLAEQERGKMLLIQVPIRNAGGGELTIDRIVSSCGCMGLERQTSDGFAPVQDLRLAAGKQERFVIRMHVQGDVEAPMRAALRFRTNDPQQPDGSIELVVKRVLGGVIASPPEVFFGTIEEGATAKQLVYLRDRTAHPRTVKKVESSNPDRIKAQLLPAFEGPDSESATGTLIGVIEVLASGDGIGPFEGTIQVWLDEEDRYPDSVRVFGRVCSAVEASPRVLVLPRSSSQGPIYFADCSLRSMSGRPFQVVHPKTPNGITVESLSNTEDGTECIMRVCATPEFVSKAEPVSLRFMVTCQGRESPLDITVLPRWMGTPR